MVLVGRVQHMLHQLSKMQFNDVFVVQDVGQLDVLAGVDAGAPDSCGFQPLSQLLVTGDNKMHDD